MKTLTRRRTPAHRAAPLPQNTITGALAAEARTLGRNAAVVTTAAGLAVGLAAPAQGSQPLVTAPAERGVASIPAIDVEPVRASLTVRAAVDTEITLDRAAVSSRPAPEPEPEPEPELLPEPQPVDAAAETGPETPQGAGDTAGDHAEPARGSQPAATAANRTPVAVTTSPTGNASTTPDTTPAAKPVEAPAAAPSGKLSVVVAAAYSGVGTPYVYGGKGPGGWDCSGFTAWAYAQAGITIPSSTSAILASGKFVRTSTPQPGDLVFQNGGGHVGIYVGNGQMIGAQNPSVGTFQHPVTRNPLHGYYTLAG